jgi:predicted S18 family serine protease
MRRRSHLLLLLLSPALSAANAADVSSQKHPDVIAAKAQPRGANRFDFDVTVSSPGRGDGVARRWGRV